MQAIFSSSWESINQNFYTKLSQSIDPLDSTFTFFAEILSTGILKSFDKDNKDVTDKDELIKLLMNPNPKQDHKQFVKEWLYYLYSHGWCHVVPQSTSAGFEKRIKRGDVKTHLFNMDGDLVKWKNDSSYFWGLFARNSDEVKFDYRPLNMSNAKFDDVIPFFDVRQNSEKPYIGVSRLLALKQQIENYSLALQAKENMIRRSGSQLISLDGKTEDMGLDSVVGTGKFDLENNPVTTTYRDRLQEQLRETGLGNNTMGVSFMNLPLKVQSLSEGLDKIDYDKFCGQDARTMMNKFNVPKEFQNLILSDVAKYDEKSSSFKFIVQSILQPLGDYYCSTFKKYFDWENDIKMTFDHLPVFAGDEETKIKTKQAKFELLKSIKEAGGMTEPEFKAKLTEYGLI